MPERLRALVLTAVAGLLITAPWPGSPQAAEKRPLAARDLVSFAYPHEASFSPDGAWIAYVLQTANVERNRWEHQVYIVGRRDGQPRLVTHGDASARQPQWSPRGRYLSFLRSKNTDYGPVEEQQVWVLSMDGGEPSAITDIASGVLQHQWSPDGRSIIVLAPEEKPGGLREYAREREERGFEAVARDRDASSKLLWRYPVPSGDRELLYKGDPGLDRFAVSPDGESIAFRSNATGRDGDAETSDIYVLEISGKKVRRITNRQGEEGNLCWTRDSRGLVVTATQIDALSFSQTEVFTIPLEADLLGGEPVPFQRWVPWTDKLDREVEQLLWPKSSGDAYIIAQDGASRRLAMLDLQGGAEWLTDEDEIVRTAAVSPDGRWMALTTESMKSPLRLVLANQDGDEKRVLADPNRESFDGIRPAEQEIFRWNSRDGLPVEGILVHPWWEDSDKPHPLIVYVHGGPNWHVTDRVLQELQVWAGWGYMVLAPNYRGSTGYGNDFATASLSDLGGGDLEDILTGVERLVDSGLADPERLAIIGGSYGGHLVQMAVSRTSRFAAAVAQYGVTSLITNFSDRIDPQWEKCYLREYSRDSLEPYLQSAPAFTADNITTPVLILHSEDDLGAFVAEARETYATLKRLGRPVELHSLSGEPQAPYQPSHLLQEVRLIQGWLDRHVTNGALWPSEFSHLKEILPEHLPPAWAELMRNTNKLPKLFRVGDTLRVTRGEPMAAIVTSLESAKTYGPETAGGRFLTVGLLFSHQGSGGSSFQLRWDDIALLEPTGRARHPVGIPQRSHGETTLVLSQDFVFRISPDAEDKNRWLPLTITFDVPEYRHTMPLVLGPFPPALISVGEAIGYE